MKQKTIPQLKKLADKHFSLAIRLRDADKYGMGTCITCSDKLHYKSGHAGHFISRRFGATRYHPENVNLQCVKCNTFNAGEQYKYGLAVDLKYGRDTAKKLHDLAHSDFRFTRPFLENVIAEAKEEVRA